MYALSYDTSSLSKIFLLHSNTLKTLKWFGTLLLNNETLRSDSPLLFNLRDHLVEKQNFHIHPVDSGNAPCFHCIRWTIIGASFCRMFENERPDSNLAIKMTIGMTVPSWKINSTHEHNFHNVTLTFARLVSWCLTRNEAEVCIDLCHVETLFINKCIVIHCVKRPFCEFTTDLADYKFAILLASIKKGLTALECCRKNTFFHIAPKVDQGTDVTFESEQRILHYDNGVFSMAITKFS